MLAGRNRVKDENTTTQQEKSCCFSCYFQAAAAPDDWKNAKSVYEFTVNDISGNPVSLEKYRGHVLLIVNVASQCGLTATNYKELQELQQKYGESKVNY